MEDSVRLFYSEGLSGSVSSKNPFISELVMEAFIEENPSIVGDEFSIISSELSLNISSGWKTGGVSGPNQDKFAGRIDLLGYNNETNTLVVIELKKEVINDCSLFQLLAYIDALIDLRRNNQNAFLTLVGVGIESDEEISNGDAKAMMACSIEGLLIGDSITSDLEVAIKANSLPEHFTGLSKSSSSSCRFKMNPKFTHIPPVLAIILNRYKDASSGKITIVAEDVASKAKNLASSKYPSLEHLINVRTSAKPLPGIKNSQYGMGPYWPKTTKDYLFVKLDDLLINDMQARYGLSVTPKYGPGAISYYGFGATTGSKVFLYIDFQASQLKIDMYIDPTRYSSLGRTLSKLNGITGFGGSSKPTNPNFNFRINDKYTTSDDEVLLTIIEESYRFRCN